jgi:hypothetical protein
LTATKTAAIFMPNACKNKISGYFKNRILVEDPGGAEFQPPGPVRYGDDLKQGFAKDIFEIGVR